MNCKSGQTTLFIFLMIWALQNANALSIKLTSPHNGARFASCADITLIAEPDIPDADVKRVIFYRDGRVLKAVRMTPWEYVMQGVPDGIYEISARLTNMSNESVDSDSIQIFVGSVADGDKIKNGEFACGIAPWALSLTGDAVATLDIEKDGWLSDESSMAVIDIENRGTENWHVMLTQPCPIDSGHTYEIYFIAEVEDSKNIGVDFQSTTGDYAVHFWQGVTLTSDTYEYGPVEFYCPVTDPSNEFKLAISEDDKSLFIDAIQVIDKNWVKNTTDVKGNLTATQNFKFLQNYPNPFNSCSEIKFELPQAVYIDLSIYNIQGQLVKTLVNEEKSKGSHSVIWDGTDEHDNAVTSGIYIYKMRAESFEMARRMLVIK
jgi:hypothetical protein